MTATLLRRGVVLTTLIFATRCQPTLDTLGQYMTTDGGLDVGVAHMVTQGEFGTFDPGGPYSPGMRGYGVTNLPNNQFSAAVPYGYGLIPISFSGTAVDVDADQRADRLDITATYEDLHTANLSLVRTDTYDDYRCWLGNLASGNGCYPAAAAPDCTFTPLGGLDYQVDATVAFRDGSYDLNPGGILQHTVVQHYASGPELSVTGQVGIPGSDGVWTVTATGAGSDAGVVTITGQVSVDAASVGTKVGFDLNDVLGYDSRTIGGLAFCSQTLTP